MKLTSPAFADRLPVPVKHTCKGSDVSPPLEFFDVPKDAKSLVLIMEDLDSSNQWVHWLVYNIPATCTYFDEAKIPDNAVDGICNSGSPGYKGPCPTNFAGVHHYSFRLYALDTILEVPHLADASVIRSEMESHVLASAELVAIAEGEQVSNTVL